MTGTLLEDPSVSNEALDLELEPVIAAEEEKEDEDAVTKNVQGFCVYGKNICVYGYDGLFSVGQ